MTPTPPPGESTAAPATRIKVCGITLADDAARVASLGIDFLGLNFWPRSKRYIALERAPLLASVARASGPIQIVGLFVDATLDEIQAVCAAVELDVLQLHGDETPDDVATIARATGVPVWKAIPASAPDDVDHLDVWSAEAILLDAPSPQRGGTGKPFDWAIAHHAREVFPARRLIIAGGLDPSNVGAAVTQLAPWAVDVASGVESAPGVKDAAKLEAFVSAVRLSDSLAAARRG